MRPHTGGTHRPTAQRLPSDRGREVQIIVDGAPLGCHEGEMVATALLAAGRGFRTAADGQPRAPLCNMGTCFECVATIDGQILTRTCLVPVRPDLTVESSDGP